MRVWIAVLVSVLALHFVIDFLSDIYRKNSFKQGALNADCSSESHSLLKQLNLFDSKLDASDGSG
jgi:hypothetical protein